MAVYYFLFNAQAPDIIDMLSDCYSKNKSGGGLGTEMRERLSRDGATYFCKVSNVDQEWIDSRTWQPGSLIWAFPYIDTNSIGYQVQRAWNYAQCPIFYPGHAPSGENIANDQERHDYWYSIWQDLINE